MTNINYTRAGYYHITEKTTGQPFPPMAAGCGNFRIPGLITLQNGDLFATCDARWDMPGDDFGGIDTVYAISHDKGETWETGYAAYFPDSCGSPLNPEDVTTCIDPDPVQTPDGRIHIFVNMNPTGITTGLRWPCTGTGFITVNGKKHLALTDKYEDTDNFYEDYPYYAGDFYDGFAPIMKTSGEITEYSLDEFCNIYKNGEIMIQKQIDTGKNIAQNIFYRDSLFHVYNTMFTLHIFSDDNTKTWHWEFSDIKSKDESACISSPGNGIITKNGDMILPFYAMNQTGFSASLTVISHDGGKTWERSPYIPATDEITWSGECKPVELDNGIIRMFFRNGIKHICYADYDRERKCWEMPVKLPVRVHSECDFSAIKSGNKILVSYPEGEGEENIHRINGKIYVFTLDETNNMTLEKSVNITDDAFSYSVLTEINENTVAVLYDTCADGLVIFKTVDI